MRESTPKTEVVVLYKIILDVTTITFVVCYQSQEQTMHCRRNLYTGVNTKRQESLGVILEAVPQNYRKHDARFRKTKLVK